MADKESEQNTEGSNRMVQMYAFLDKGSNTSFCSEKLAKELNLNRKRTTLSLTTMEEDSKTDCRIVSLEVLDLDEENIFEVPVVFTRPSLPITTESVTNEQDVERWWYLSEVKIPNIDVDVGLLIGSDIPVILKPKQVIPSQNGGPYATRTTLGWVVNGPLGKVTNTNTHTANLTKANLQLNEQFQSYCNMEFNDSAYSEARSMSANDKHAMELMRDSISLENGHYQLALPWKNDPPCLENNRSVVDHYLKLLKWHLSRGPQLRSKQKDCMEDLLKGDTQLKPSQPKHRARHGISPITLSNIQQNQEKYVLCLTVLPSTMANLLMTNSYRGRILQIPLLEYWQDSTRSQ